jgi:hypothetical protein
VTDSYERVSADLASLVGDPLEHLPVHWTPAELPPCSKAVMERVLTGLQRLGSREQRERR